MKPASKEPEATPRHVPRLDDPQDVRDVLTYQLIRLTTVCTAPILRWCEGGFGVSRRQWRVLAAISAHGSLQSSQLAQQAQLDRVQTSRALRELEARELIARSAQVGDRRFVRVSITARGQELYDQLWPLVRAHHIRLVSVLSTEQLSAMRDMIEVLRTHSEQLLVEYGDMPKANRRAGRSARPVVPAR